MHSEWVYVLNLKQEHTKLEMFLRMVCPIFQDVVVDMDASEVKVLEKANVNQQTSLVCEVCPDPMEGEQTWPTDEELAEAERQRKVVKRVPKGTSEYQAAWIVDSGDEQVSRGVLCHVIIDVHLHGDSQARREFVKSFSFVISDKKQLCAKDP